MLIVDLETRSSVPIHFGVHKYCEDVQILCMAYAFDDGPVRRWTPEEEFPLAVHTYFAMGHDVAARNAAFEYEVFKACLPDIAPTKDQWVCTATLAAACGLPRSLANNARCLGTPHQKDVRGKFLIKECCIPPYNEDPKLLRELLEYCVDDVETDRDCMNAMRQMTDAEMDDFYTNMIINERGIPVDLELANMALEYAEDEVADLVDRIKKASYDDLDKKAGTKLTMWVYHNLTDDLQDLMHRYKDGEKSITLDSSARHALLTAEAPLDSNVHEVILCADLAGRSSVAKYQAMINRAGADGRVRGSYIMNGASPGRFSSTGLQMHNLPRNAHPAPESVIQDMFEDYALDDCMTTLSRMLRPAIKAQGKNTLVWGDWSAIEGRILPWLADSKGSEAKLNLYREGQDVYVHTAAGIFGLKLSDIDADLRFTGKVAELALGYAGGAGALHSMGRNFGVTFEEDQVTKIRDQWRNNNAWAVQFWAELELAAVSAWENPGVLFPAGRVSYLYIPEVLMGALWCQLPSGRLLCYPGLKRTLESTPWGDAYQLSSIKGNLKPKATEKDWPRVRLWKGLLAENVTQAVAADILREALRTMVLDEGLPVIGHTHDEVILETEHIEATTCMVEDIMEAPPGWAKGLPLAVKMGFGRRYGK